MKDKKYDYMFTHIQTKAKLKFTSTTVQEAIKELATMVNSVQDWDMRRFTKK
jgi:hypothetical protein